ncbi:MAG: lipoyl(octanoyl) transferase LipB [Bacteroidetes bacterium]|nr:lipoyl(octanoyl) transferase LipB [Bacteroidota bacterium]
MHVLNIGKIGYQKAWDLQQMVFTQRLRDEMDDTLLLCEHPHTYTVGKNGVDNLSRHLLLNKEELAANGISVFEIDRGGDITYHGPGQLVGYPILNLNNYYRDVHRYLRDLEEVILKTLAKFSITARRVEESTGVWVDTPSGPEKICAIGVKVTRWITMHGFALNMNANLDYFNHIIPCGISDKGVTSMSKILDRLVDERAVIDAVDASFREVFVSRAIAA